MSQRKDEPWELWSCLAFAQDGARVGARLSRIVDVFARRRLSPSRCASKTMPFCRLGIGEGKAPHPRSALSFSNSSTTYSRLLGVHCRHRDDERPTMDLSRPRLDLD